MSERERAEAFLDNGTAILKSWNEIFTELGMPSPTRRALIDDLLAFSREERARAWEEARGLLLAQQCHEPFYGSAIYKQVVVDFARWIDKLVDMCEERAKQLRKEEHGTTR